MRFVFFVLFAVVAVQALAQASQNTDSLERVFHTLPPEKKIKAANRLMQYYLDVNFEKTGYYARQAFELAKSKSIPPEDVAYTYISWGIIQYDRSNYDSSLIYTLKALRYYESVPDTAKMAVAYNNISLAYNAQGEFAKAAVYAYRALLIYQKYKRWSKAGIASLNLSGSYFEAKHYERALYWARQGLQYYQQANDSAEFAYALQVFADVYIARKQIDSAQWCIKQVEALNAKFPNEYLAMVSLSQRGEIYFLQGKYDSARIVQQQCIAFYDQLGLAESVQQTRIGLARTWLALGNVQAAQQQAQMVYKIASKIGKKRLIVESCLLLADIYKAKNEWHQALNLHTQAGLYKDSIINKSLYRSIEGQLSDIRLEQEIQDKSRVLETLVQHDKIVYRQRFIIIAITIALLTFIVIAFLIRRVSLYRRKTNQQLLANNVRLNALNQEVNGLVSTIVHDLNAPLNGIRGVLNMLETMPASNESKELVALAQTSVTVGLDIVKQLLELRELESGTFRLTRDEIHVQHFLDGLHKVFRAQAGQKKIAFSCEGTDYTFVSDKISLQRIFSNLISNAIKFSHPGGRVAVSVMQYNGCVTFVVSDEGQGFTEDDQKKMYGKFQKLSARPTAGEPSNGLGLAIVNLLVQHLQGTITLDSQRGKGSTFTITFPDVLKN